MPHSTLLPPSTVHAQINYYSDAIYGGLEQHVEVYMSAKSRRQQYDPKPVLIRDIRDSNEDFELDTSGLKLVEFPDIDITFDDREYIMREVWPAAEEIVKEHTGASCVRVFAHIIRNASYEDFKNIRDSAETSDSKIVNKEHPAMFAHGDYSYKGAYTLLESYKANDQLPNKPPDLDSKVKHRWALINVWRPIKPITREPLAVCDARTVEVADLRPVISRVPRELHPDGVDHDSEYWQVAANDKHKWYWASNMGTNEALVFKQFDTKLNGVSRVAPHSAFQTPGDHGPPRESIELRCIAFWEDQERE